MMDAYIWPTPNINFSVSEICGGGRVVDVGGGSWGWWWWVNTGGGRGWMQGDAGGGGRYPMSKTNEKLECCCFFFFSFFASYWLVLKGLMDSIFTMQSVCLVGWLSELKFIYYSSFVILFCFVCFRCLWLLWGDSWHHQILQSQHLQWNWQEDASGCPFFHCW